MAKQNGLGDNLYVGGYDVSGDIGNLSAIRGGPAALDVTAINNSAFSRIGGIRDGAIEYTAYFNPTGVHVPLSALPTADQVVTYCNGTTLGNPAAVLVSKQIDYAGTRGADGSFTFKVTSQANGYGLEWGQQLTAGLRTDTTATNGTSIDTAASMSLGGQAYLQVTAFSGTDVTIKIQDSADNSTFADVTSFGFTAVTAAPFTQRLQLGGTATLRRYLRAVTATSGGFTSVTFSVVVAKNTTAVTF